MEFLNSVPSLNLQPVYYVTRASLYGLIYAMKCIGRSLEFQHFKENSDGVILTAVRDTATSHLLFLGGGGGVIA